MIEIKNHAQINNDCHVCFPKDYGFKVTLKVLV